jgi:methyl-accepting chemotaxis protein
MKLSDIRIGTKLAAISAAGVLLVAGMMAATLHGNTAVREAASNAVAQQLNTRDGQAILAESRSMALGVRDLRLSDSKQTMQKALETIESHRQRADGIISSLIDRAHAQDERELGSRIKTLLAKYEAATQRELLPLKSEILELQVKAKQGDEAAGIRALSQTEQLMTVAREQTLPVASAIEDAVHQIDARASRLAEVEKQAAMDEISSVERLSIGIGSAVVLVLIGSAVFTAYSVARPLRALVDPLQELAQGNFAISIAGTGRKDEVGLIAAAAEAVVERVGATIGNIKIAATEVTSASAEISTSTTDLSQRTEEQAASLEETSASMEQIAATVHENSESARLANEFASETSAVAERGGAVVSDAVAAMARIEESSRKISDIIGVIDEIARQTNLLALNAAVEAARAGEAGRGFAVVASEVRSLAQRSSQAAKDIKDLIINSNSQVKDGVDLVNKAGQSLDEIVASIKKVAAIVAEISNASLEQSSGIEQINKALTQMDEVTQQNSALVEENAATAKTLEQQARSMDERVASFRLRAEAAQAATASAKSAADGGLIRAASAAPDAAPQRAAKGAAAGRRPARPAKRAAAGGPVRDMHEALATAFDTDGESREF